MQAKELIQSIVINEETVFLLKQLEKYFTDPVLMKPKELNLQLQLQIIDLINSMVPDSAIIKKVLALLDNTMSHLRRGRKPVLFILRDLKEELSEIYHITEKRIIRLIDNADLEKGLEYCRQEIKELKRKMLKAENQKCSYHENLEHLKKLLQIEVDCNNQIVKEKPVDMTRLLKPHKTKVKKLTFGLNHSKAQQLEKILNALCVHIDLLDNQSEVKDVMEVFNPFCS